MDPLLSTLIEEIKLSGSLRQDVAAFLNHHECPNTAAHSFGVAEKAAELARRFDADPARATLSAWLHDISAVIPNDQRLEVSQALGLEILAEEAEVPLLLHQKLSALLAEQIFNVSDQGVLSAIGCHTTLKANPAQLDTLLFVADKLAWDQKGTPPYQTEMEQALEESLELAAFRYQDYLLHSGKILTPHPWMLDSFRELSEKFG
ncbi:MAG: bis(5'-nucleosyl)-tetraphosphatase (symmetrical) YqeK [Chloroflexota bacterium]